MGPTALDSSINRYLEMMECFSEVTRGSAVTPKLGLGPGQPLPSPGDMPTSGTTGSQKLPASVPKGHTTPLLPAAPPRPPPRASRAVAATRRDPRGPRGWVARSGVLAAGGTGAVGSPSPASTLMLFIFCFFLKSLLITAIVVDSSWVLCPPLNKVFLLSSS